MGSQQLTLIGNPFEVSVFSKIMEFLNGFCLPALSVHLIWVLWQVTSVEKLIKQS